MTTLVQIKKWTRPLLDADPNLVLVGRWLFLKPVRHILRGLLIDRTSAPEWSRMHYALIPLFEHPHQQMGFRWSNQLDLGRNTDPVFADEFMTKSRDVITEVLSGGETVADFVSQIERDRFPSLRGLGAYDLATFPREYCVILAALGDLDRSAALLAEVTRHEAAYRKQLSEAEAERVRRPRSSSAKYSIKWAMGELAVLEHLGLLKQVVDRRDRVAIGKLLREWERHNARLWGVEHLWEPTPFPVERA